MSSCNLKFSFGSFTKYKDKENYYICNMCSQANYSSKNKFICDDIFKTFPESDIYLKTSNYKLNVGDILVKDKIINMITQKWPGKAQPNKKDTSDTFKKRYDYFNECLKNIENYNFFPDEDEDVYQEKITLVIPYSYSIIQENDWDNYIHLINEYTKITKKIKTIILLDYIANKTKK